MGGCFIGNRTHTCRVDERDKTAPIKPEVMTFVLSFFLFLIVAEAYYININNFSFRRRRKSEVNELGATQFFDDIKLIND